MPDTHPTVRVALLVAEFKTDDTTRKTTVSHRFIAPVSVVNCALFILYSPPTTETAVCPPIPEMTTELDIYAVESSALVTLEKLNVLGITSPGTANANRES